MSLIHNMCQEITLLKLHVLPYLPVTNELTNMSLPSTTHPILADLVWRSCVYIQHGPYTSAHI